DLFDFAFQEFDVADARLALVLARERQHVVRHVEAVDLAGRADAPRREEDVEAAARAEVEHRFTLAQVDERRRIAAAERGVCRLRRYVAALAVRVQAGRDRIAAGRAAAAAALRGRARGGAVFLLNRLLQFFGCRHGRSLPICHIRPDEYFER